MSTFKALKQDAFLDMGADRWGTAMNLWFGIAAELYVRGVEVPSHWQYVPKGSDPRDRDGFFYETFKDAKRADLIRLGNILERYTRYLDKKGESY